MAAENMIPLTSMPTPPNRLVDPPITFSERAQATADALNVIVNQLNTNVIPKHNTIVQPVNNVLANLTEIKNVSTDIASVVNVSGIKNNVVSVDGIKNQVVRVSTSADKIDRVYASIAKVDTVNDHIAKVDTVNDHIAKVDTVANDITKVNTVSNDILNVNTTATNISSVNNVSSHIAEVVTVSGISSAVSDLSADHAMLTRLDVSMPILTRVDANSVDISTVADIENQVKSIVTDKPIIDVVYEKLPTLQNISDNITHIVNVDEAETAIRLLGTHINNIDAVGASIDAVNAVNASLANITAVKESISFVKNVSDHIVNVDAVGRNIEAVKEVDRRIDLVISAPTNAAIASDAAIAAQKDAALAKQYAESASAVAGLPVATAQNDKQVVYWNAQKGAYDLGSTVGESLLPAPAVTVASQLPVGFPIPITLTGLPGLVGTTIVTFQLQVNDAPIQDLVATNGSYEGTITAQGSGGTVWTIKARAIDSKGNVSLWNQTTASLVIPKVNTPTVTSPLSGAIVSNKTVSLTSSAFGTTYLTDTHKASRWTITTDVEGNNILHDSGWRQDMLLSYTAVIDPVADKNTTIYLHVQHQGVLIGNSEKSVALPVKTSYVVRPSITSPLLSTMVGTDRVDLTSSDFTTYAGNFDTHVSSRWLVTTDAVGNNALCDSGWVSSYLTEYTAVLSPLADPSSDLYLWVMHRGETLGDSERSTSVRVVTGSLQAPTITSPSANGIVLPTGFTIVGSAFAPTVGATDTMKALYVQVATDALFTDKIYDSGRILTTSTTFVVSFPAQPQAKVLYVRMRYEGNTLGISGYSEPVAVVTTKVGTVSVTSPINGATGVPTKPLITMTGYSDTGNYDTGVNTQVQVSTDSAFSNIVYDSGEGAYSTTHSVVTALSPAVQYFIRIRHKGRVLGWTDWSEAVSITTGQVQTPSISSPAENGYILPTKIDVVGSAFVALGTSDTLKSVTIQVAKDIGFTNMVYNQKITSSATTHTVTIPAQAQGSALFVRIAYEGNALGMSEFSVARRIIVTTVIAPTITNPANNATGVSLRPTITMTPWSDTGGLDTGSKTRVQISEKSDFSTIAWDSGEIAYTTSVQCGISLKQNTTHYIRAQYYGVSLGWINYSAYIIVRTTITNYMSIFGGTTSDYIQKTVQFYKKNKWYYALFGYGNSKGIFGLLSITDKYGNVNNQINIHSFISADNANSYNDACYVNSAQVIFAGGYSSGSTSTDSRIAILDVNVNEQLMIIKQYEFVPNGRHVSCMKCACVGDKVLVGWYRYPNRNEEGYIYGLTLFRVTSTDITVLDTKEFSYYRTSSAAPRAIINSIRCIDSIPNTNSFYISGEMGTLSYGNSYDLSNYIMKVSCDTNTININFCKHMEAPKANISQVIYGFAFDEYGNTYSYGRHSNKGFITYFNADMSSYYGLLLDFPNNYSSYITKMSYFKNVGDVVFSFIERTYTGGMNGFSIGKLSMNSGTLSIKDMMRIVCSDKSPSAVNGLFYDNYRFVFIGNTQSRGTHGSIDCITGTIYYDNIPVISTFPEPAGWYSEPSTSVVVTNYERTSTVPQTDLSFAYTASATITAIPTSMTEFTYSEDLYEF